jgi:hypothetical protein
METNLPRKFLYVRDMLLDIHHRVACGDEFDDVMHHSLGIAIAELEADVAELEKLLAPSST